MTLPYRSCLAGLAAVLVACGLDFALSAPRPPAGAALNQPSSTQSAQEDGSGPLATLGGRREWLNVGRSGAPDLRGKVVVVNFWTYSCINSLRALPHLKAWHEAYRGQGLVVVGVHAPEFGFEHELGNVAQAAASLGVRYPVVLDNQFRTWRALGNSGWPGLYLIDRDGRLAFGAVGKERYDEVERVVRRLLAADGPARAAPTGTGVEAPADWGELRSPETYLGAARAERFVGASLVAGGPGPYRPAAAQLPVNGWDLSDAWTVGREFAMSNRAGAGIRYRFDARDIHLVMAPRSPERPVRFRVTLDGAAHGSAHGGDTDAAGRGAVDEARLYQLARQTGAVRDRTLEIEFLDPGIHAYVFTFG